MSLVVVVSVLAKLPLVVNVVRMAINHNKINMIIDQLLAIAIAIAVPRCAGGFVFADDGDASVAAMIIMDTTIIFIIVIVIIVVVT